MTRNVTGRKFNVVSTNDTVYCATHVSYVESSM